MTPKEKAKELIDKFSQIELGESQRTGLPFFMRKYEVKQCALIAVEELIKMDESFNNMIDSEFNQITKRPTFLEQVKEEIKKL